MLNFSAVLIFVLCNSFSFIEQGSTVITSSSKDNNPSASGTTSAAYPISVTEIEEQSTDQEKLEETESDADDDDDAYQYAPDYSKCTEAIYEAFFLLRNPSSIRNDELDFKLPTRYSYHEIEKKLHLVAEEPYNLDTLLCPEIETTDRNLRILMDNLDKMMPEAESCLYIADDGQKTCKLEPSAKLQVDTTKVHEIEEEIICGINDQQKLIKTVFLNCGTKENMRKYAQIKVQQKNEAPEYEMRSYPMYATCYDFEHQQTLWTRHTVLTPALLAHEKYPYNSFDTTINIRDFSTSTHYTKLKPRTLDTLKEAYESTESNKKKIHSLVPKEHMALPHWKQSTNHMINTAPLLPKFKPLMRAINEGIFKASAYALAKYGRTLEIYTKADTTTTSTSKIKRTLKKFFSGSEGPSFTSNTWYKFIYEEQDRSGILIVLHNTKGFVEDKECTDHENTCDFQTWIDNKTISRDTLTYAYCCHVSQDRIKQLFSMNELKPIEGTLELQQMINSYPNVIENVSQMGI